MMSRLLWSFLFLAAIVVMVQSNGQPLFLYSRRRSPTVRPAGKYNLYLIFIFVHSFVP